VQEETTLFHCCLINSLSLRERGRSVCFLVAGNSINVYGTAVTLFHLLIFSFSGPRWQVLLFFFAPLRETFFVFLTPVYFLQSTKNPAVPGSLF
jgi:hypothetical protein